MEIIADLQVHSKHARAVSRYMELPAMAEAAAQKGIGLLATGDWQHPQWFRSINEELEEREEGLFALRSATGRTAAVRFALVSEVSCMYRQGSAYRRVHHLIFSPSLKACQRIITALEKQGANLRADGRPLVFMSSHQLLELLLEADSNTLLIPAHVWTPWFGLYGSKTGFDSLQECFGDLSDQVYAIETGLSSDPVMNWQIAELDNRAILSFSDAHSAAKLGREATIFTSKNSTFTYSDLRDGIRQEKKSGMQLGYTLEFFPEEGKYHWSGHRACGIRYSPEDEQKNGLRCPVCHKTLTVGVAHRVQALASRTLTLADLKQKRDANELTFMHHPTQKRTPFVSLVPLLEILQEVWHSPTKAKREYARLTAETPEFTLLLHSSLADVARLGGERLAEAVRRVRRREISIEPGYDGVFGTVKILND